MVEPNKRQEALHKSFVIFELKVENQEKSLISTVGTILFSWKSFTSMMHINSFKCILWRIG